MADNPTKEQKLDRIAQIDEMFQAVTGWGSWMWDASGERWGLVNSLKKYDGVEIEHKYERSLSHGRHDGA